MKKILYTASTFGHLASFHRPYIKWFSDKGCEVHVAAGGASCDFQGVARCIELPFQKSMFSLRNFIAVWKLTRILRRERYDLISTHTALAAFFTRLAVMLAGKRDTVVMNTSHGYLFDNATNSLKRALLLGAEEIVAGVTDYVLTMNRQDAEIARKYRLAREIVETPGMGVDFSHFAVPDNAMRESARREFGLPPEAFVLVYAAEFSKRKNQRMLIDALCALPEKVHLLLPGKGDQMEVCRARAAQCGVGHRVHFPGFVQYIEQAYHAADVCVSASRIEGLPFNVMEAMALGLPAVVTAIKGHEDLVADGESGFLYPYDDADAFRRAIFYLLSTQNACLAMQAEAKHAMRMYDLALVFPQLTQIYSNALQAGDNGIN